jgi:thymidylate synthase (FAD)
LVGSFQQFNLRKEGLMKKWLYEDDKCFVELVDSVGSDLTVVNSARVSLGKCKKILEEDDKKLIKYLIRNKHTSTLEHCFVTFRVKVPLFVRSQHHRHRTWSYNEISRRYTDFNIEFYEPKAFRTQHSNNRQASNSNELINPILNEADKDLPGFGEWTWEYSVADAVVEHHKESLRLFENLIKSGVCREQARGILPQNMLTEYYASANLNNILKFIDLRTHEGAQWEIQEVAKAMLNIILEIFPETVRAYNETFKG